MGRVGEGGRGSRCVGVCSVNSNMQHCNRSYEQSVSISSCRCCNEAHADLQRFAKTVLSQLVGGCPAMNMCLFLTRSVLFVFGLLVQGCLAEKICVRAQFVKRSTIARMENKSQEIEEGNLANLFSGCEIVLLQWDEHQNSSRNDKILAKVNGNVPKYGGEFASLYLPIGKSPGESKLYFRNDAFGKVDVKEHALSFTKVFVVKFYLRQNTENQNFYFMLVIFMALGRGGTKDAHRNEMIGFLNSTLFESNMAPPAALIGHYHCIYAKDLIKFHSKRAVYATKDDRQRNLVFGCQAVLFNRMTNASCSMPEKGSFSLTFFRDKPIELILDTAELFTRHTAAPSLRSIAAAGYGRHFVERSRSRPVQTPVHRYHLYPEATGRGTGLHYSSPSPGTSSELSSVMSPAGITKKRRQELIHGQLDSSVGNGQPGLINPGKRIYRNPRNLSLITITEYHLQQSHQHHLPYNQRSRPQQSHQHHLLYNQQSRPQQNQQHHLLSYNPQPKPQLDQQDHMLYTQQEDPRQHHQQHISYSQQEDPRQHHQQHISYNQQEDPRQRHQQHMLYNQQEDPRQSYHLPPTVVQQRMSRHRGTSLGHSSSDWERAAPQAGTSDGRYRIHGDNISRDGGPLGQSDAASRGRPDEARAIKAPLQQRFNSRQPSPEQEFPLDLTTQNRRRYRDQPRDNEDQQRVPTPPAERPEAHTPFWNQK